MMSPKFLKMNLKLLKIVKKLQVNLILLKIVKKVLELAHFLGPVIQTMKICSVRQKISRT